MHHAPAVRKATTAPLSGAATALAVVDALTLPSGPSVWTMWRKPQAPGSRA